MNHSHLKKILILGAPLLAGLVSEFLMVLADSVMVGRLGTDYLAAIGIATIFGELLWVIVWPLAPGTQSIASRRFGRQKKEADRNPATLKALKKRTGETLDNALIVSVVVGCGAIAVGLFAKPILNMLLDDKDLIPLAYAYIATLKWAMPLACVFYAIYGFLAAVNQTKIIMVATIGLNLVNVVFNYMFIFGKFGFPALGIMGAALGTVIAQSLGTVFLVGYALLATDVRPYHCLTFTNLRGDIINGILRSASPIIAQLGSALFIFLYYESMIANLDILYLAATHIVFTIFVLKRTMVGGFAEGGSILVGNALGEEKKREAVRYAYASEVIAILIGVVMFGLIFFFPDHIVRVFNADAALVEAGSKALRFFAPFLLIEAVGFPFEVIFTHNGWGRYVLISEIATNVVCIIGCTLLFTRVFDFGIYGAWSAFALYLVFHSLFMFAGFFSRKWTQIQVDHEWLDAATKPVYSP
ncbi:MAG: MATE family efflux transporter [Deltaproteobacteria bacterium]|nr:MATE family efflux transporter [Deltaproteobacteria bacterium]